MNNTGPMQETWIPTPYNLLGGNPFAYSEHAISVTSATEAFETDIDSRDGDACVVCRINRCLDHAHIIPTRERETWALMREKAIIPCQAKSVAHEPRNGILLCKNHHHAFDHYEFYIRWVPQSKRFVFINHSQLKYMEQFHGKAVHLHPGDRVPFHGCFLMHEMRVRGYWPWNEDRPISFPILWASNGMDGNDKRDKNKISEENANEGHHATTSTPSMGQTDPADSSLGSTSNASQHGVSFPANASTGRKKGHKVKTFTMTPTNPFANPVELKALKDSFAEQPNWKAAVVEGETWEGTGEENIKKYQEAVGHHE
ncbi:hypothetical protein M413DRAFT_29320 [Hebeloma cylindrosporum]|uniref:HNH nuclease domain-containing protein n=1 Tax=Hebeloma cylindrosporum TaxID=76867 RepID=A0A0C3C7U5_HEBCY|nr:hypothetical protein M413DRAFT_29320 [Hebeloma cylindrosporum h7]